MIEISLWKILMVLAVALVVLGPKQLSKAAQSLGRLVLGARKTLQNVQKELETTLEHQKPADKDRDSQTKG